MEILVTRTQRAPNFTLSTWAVDQVHECVGVELPVLPPCPGGIHAVPEGRYRVFITRSTRFSQLAGHDVFKPLLQDLPGRTTLLHGKPLNDCGIRIHSGNVVNGYPVGHPQGPKSAVYDPQDPLRNDSLGCLLAGLAYWQGRGVSGSQAAANRLQAKIAAALGRGEKVFITIK